VLLEGLSKLKDLTSSGTRTGDLPACSIVPEPTTLPRSMVLPNFPFEHQVLWSRKLLMNPNSKRGREMKRLLKKEDNKGYVNIFILLVVKKVDLAV
jgi:hypothetical protein